MTPTPAPKQEESPTPWQINPETACEILDAGGKYIAITDGVGTTVAGDDANAAHIVLAVNTRPVLLAAVRELREALKDSQVALIGITSELGVIEAQMPGGLPYGIKKPKIAVDLALCGNAKVFARTEGVGE